MGTTVFGSFLVITVLLVDILYGFVDPRIKVERIMSQLDFSPVETKKDKNIEMRPSLSYWQDAGVDSKRKTRHVSCSHSNLHGSILFSGAFTLGRDPNRQQLKRPYNHLLGASPVTAVIEDPIIVKKNKFDCWRLPSSAVQNLQTVGLASTVQIHLKWDALPFYAYKIIQWTSSIRSLHSRCPLDVHALEYKMPSNSSSSTITIYCRHW